jgi:hypothetical protein
VACPQLLFQCPREEWASTTGFRWRLLTSGSKSSLSEPQLSLKKDGGGEGDCRLQNIGKRKRLYQMAVIDKFGSSLCEARLSFVSEGRKGGWQRVFAK